MADPARRAKEAEEAAARSAPATRPGATGGWFGGPAEPGPGGPGEPYTPMPEFKKRSRWVLLAGALLLALCLAGGLLALRREAAPQPAPAAAQTEAPVQAGN